MEKLSPKENQFIDPLTGDIQSGLEFNDFDIWMTDDDWITNDFSMSDDFSEHHDYFDSSTTSENDHSNDFD